jgi:hypothetical protein
MNKPIAPENVYRKKATNAPLAEFFRTPTFEEKESIKGTVEFMLKSIVQKHSA